MSYNKIFLVIGVLVLATVGVFAFIFFLGTSSHDHQQMVHADHETAKHPEGKEHLHDYAHVYIDPQRVQLMGIATERIKIRELNKTIRTVGIVDVDETRKSVVQTKFSGWIEKLFINFTGIPVKKGQPLFTVYSPELHATQEEYLLALGDGSNGKGYLEKQFKNLNNDLIRAARKRLELWDIPDDEISRLEKEKKPSKTLTLLSPCKGIVLDKHAFIGMNVEPGIPIFIIADLSHVWVVADMYEQDIALIKRGQTGKIATTSFPDKTLKGVVTFINYTIDNPMRTAKIRFECDNKDFALKPGMYATVTIEVPMGTWLALPEESLIDTGKRKIAFVALGDGHYEPREVQLGHKANAYYQILGGLDAGDAVVTSAQFLLDSESRIKASGSGGMKEHGM